MGGRKSYDIHRVVGSDKKLISQRRKLAAAIDSGKPEEIVQSTVNLFKESGTGIRNLSAAIDMYDFFTKRIEAKEPADIKKDIGDFWIKTKEGKGLKTSSEIDRIIVDSAVKVLRRRGQK